MPDPASAPPAAPAPAAPAPASIPAAPAAPAAPAPPASVTPPSGADPRPSSPSFMDEIDSMAAGTTPPKPPAKGGGRPPVPPTKGSPAAAGSAPSAGKEGVEPTGGSGAPPATGTPSPSASPALDEKAIAKMPPQLREAYRAQNRELATVRQELEKLKATAKPAEDPEKKTLAEALEGTKKRVAELEQELKYHSFEQTDEYKQQYQQPFEDAYNQGRQVASELSVTLEDGSERPGASEDFDKVMMAPNTVEANNLAVQLFGTQAPLIMAERRSVILANQKRVKAIEEFRKNGAERDAKRQADLVLARQQQAEQAKQVSETFKKLGQEHITARPEFMTAEDTDAEGKQILTASEAVANLLFGTLTPEQAQNLPPKVRELLVEGKLPPEHVVRLHAETWAKVRSYGFVTHKLKKAQARVQELETALAEYESSAPGAGGGRRGEDPNRQMTAEEEIDAMAAGK